MLFFFSKLLPLIHLNVYSREVFLSLENDRNNASLLTWIVML